MIAYYREILREPNLKTRLFQLVLCTIALPLSLFYYYSEASAETLEIALPDLIGLYHADVITSRLDTFQLSKSPTMVNSVSIRLAGSHQLSTYCCDWAGDICGPWPVVIDAYIPDVVTPATWTAHSNAPSETYSMLYPYPIPYECEITIPFVSASGATWDFLKALEGTIRLDCKPITYNFYHCYTFWDEPYVEIAAAVLVIEGEFSVGVSESSWGKIKALYSQ
jgi:hypothetical protein